MRWLGRVAERRVSVVVSVAVSVSVAVAVLWPADIARAQFERSGAPPPTGVLQPGASLTLDADAGDLETNPAQLGWLRSWSVLLVHTELLAGARYLGQGTGAFLGFKVPLLPLSVGLGAQVLRPGAEFGERYPTLGKLSLGLALQPKQWLSLGLGAHVFVSPASPVRNGLTTLDAGITVRPTPWLSLATVLRDLSNTTWAGLPLQRRWEFEIGVKPLASDRLSFAVGIAVGERRKDLSPRAVIQGEPWPGFSLFADATWLRRDLDSGDGMERRVDDVRFTVGLRLNFERVGIGAAFVGGAPGLPGGVAAGVSVSMRISGDRYRTVNRDRKRVLLVDLGEGVDARTHWRRLTLLHGAARQRGVRAVLVKIGGGLGWGVSEEVRRAFAALRKRGKKVIVYLYAATAQGYYMALAADRILLFPGGGLRFAGLVSVRLYFKKVLDKLGIRAQIYRYGEYKSAPEAFTAEGPSPAASKVRDALLDDFVGRYHAALATRPKIRSVVRARQVLAKGPFNAKEALTLGLVDKLVFPDKVPDEVHKILGRRLNIEPPPNRARKPRDWGLAPVVAVVAVEGDIVDGDSRTLPLIGRRLAGARTLIKLLGGLANESRVKAVVLRVDTGGGSALGSEALWRTVQQLAKIKPVVASLGNVAASGGYFVAAPAKIIYAEPSCITGSIGIFAGKADLSGLLAKVGIGVDIKKRGGARAGVDTPYRPYTPAEQAALKKKLRYYYLRFVDAVAAGRKKLGKRAKVLPLAAGRVWSGAQARQKGLVDRSGGLYEAVQAARKLAGLRAGDGHRVVVLPRPGKSLLGRLVRFFVKSPKPMSRSHLSPLIQKLLAPLSRIPPSLLVSGPDTPQARLPYDITIR
jgi:protease IV